MKKFMVVLVMVAAVGLVAGNAEAQDSNWVEVSATVVGIFDFTLTEDGLTYADFPVGTPAVFDFGSVSADGSTDSNGLFTSRNGTDDAGVYDAAAAFGWQVISAPSRLVDITSAAATVTTANLGTGGTALDGSNLEIAMTDDTGTAAAAGSYATTDAGATLVDDVDAGNGANNATGDINLRLTVPDEATPGDYTWEIQLTATQV